MRSSWLRSLHGFEAGGHILQNNPQPDGVSGHPPKENEMAVQDVKENAISSHPITRRTFLEGAGKTGAALIVGCFLDGTIGVLNAAAAATGQDQMLNAWVRVSSDDKVTIVVSQAEMGQGIMSTLPLVLAEELGADWDRVQLEMSPTADAYRNPRINWQFTGNSESTTSFFELMRQVGASAREMLISAAADRWRVAPASCFADDGKVIHRPTGRKLKFGELAATAGSK